MRPSSIASAQASGIEAAEVLVDGGAARLIRRRQTVDELLALEQLTALHKYSGLNLIM